MRDLLFGVAYYLEYMPYDRLEEDIRMMKAAGMNVIRIAESTWSTLEPEEGVYDFSYIDRVLEIAEREKLWVIIGTPTYAVPAWMIKKYPEIMVFDGEKRAKYGHRQLMDIMHPEFRRYAENIIRRLMEHVVNHPRVIGVQIDNETKHYGTSSELVQQLFVEYLKDKFQTTDRLNAAFGLAYWSNSIHDWSDFPDTAGCINGGLAGEFSAFQRSLAAEYLKWQSDIVREYITDDQFITHNFDFEWKKFGADIAQDGYSYGVQPDIVHAEAAKAVTIAGTDIYHPTQDNLTGAEIAFGGDEIRCLKQAPYLVLECQAQAFKYWTPYPGQLRQHAYSHLASGAASVLYWNWHSIHSGYETYWKGVLSHDLAVNPTYEEAAVIGHEFMQHGKESLCIHKKNTVALVTDNRSLSAFQWFPIDKDLSYNDVVRWMYDALYEMNVECDVVDVNILEPSEYKVIITPALYCISEEHLGKIKQFVADGGVLISSFKSFVADEQVAVYHDAQPHHMTEVFGVTYNQFTEPGTTLVSEKPVTYFMELLNTTTADVLEKYEHRYWGKYAAITHNVYGQGHSYYVGCFVDKEILKRIYEQALQQADILVPETKFPVIVRSGINEKGEVLHYVFNYSQEETEIVCPYPLVRDVLGGDVYRKGDRVYLKDWDVKILREESAENAAENG